MKHFGRLDVIFRHMQSTIVTLAIVPGFGACAPERKSPAQAPDADLDALVDAKRPAGDSGRPANDVGAPPPRVDGSRGPDAAAVDAWVSPSDAWPRDIDLVSVADAGGSAEAGMGDAGVYHALTLRICDQLCHCPNGENQDGCPLVFRECQPYPGVDGSTAILPEECSMFMETILDGYQLWCSGGDTCACLSLEECIEWESTATCDPNSPVLGMIVPAVCVGGVSPLEEPNGFHEGLCYNGSQGSYSACRQGLSSAADAGVPPP